MVSVAIKLNVLLWKCLILRKRNWCLSFFELICPLFVTFACYTLNRLGRELTEESNPAIGGGFSVFPTVSIFSTPVSASHIAYAPSNSFTDEIMARFNKSLQQQIPEYRNSSTLDSVRRMSVEAIKSEPELDLWLENRTFLDKYVTHSVGIVFLETNTIIKRFKYKIRTNFNSMVTKKTRDSFLASLQLYEISSFLGTQVRLDRELLKSIGLNYQEGGRLLGVIPVPEKTFMVAIYVMYLFMMLAYVFLVTSVVRDVVQEKATGIKELMRIMGVSSWMIWIHWLMYTLLIHLPVTIGVTILLAVLEPRVVQVNPFIIWLIFFLFTLNCIFLLFVVSCLFNGAVRGTTLSVLAWFVLHLVNLNYIGTPGDFQFSVQILFCLVPLNNLCWILHTLITFSDHGISWEWRHLFTEGFTGSHISLGVSIIIFVLNTMFLILILTFLDAVKPGPYGVAKPITFVCQWCKNMCKCSKQPVSNSPSFLQSPLSRSFELPPETLKVGIRIRELRKEYGLFNKVVAVDNVNLDIYEGEIMALLGHNGAGKTTTMSMVTGMFSPTQGIITVDGIDIYSELSRFRKSLGLCTQHNIYFPKFTVIEHLLFFGMLKGMSYSESKEDSEDLLDLLKIDNKKNSRVSKLSGGMQRRLCLAASLIGQPKILILDEPTSGLDPETRRQIWNIILSMRGHRTILITTHFMEEADVLGDRIAIMDHGRVVCCGSTMFLKKLYGTGYHIHMLKEPDSPVEDIAKLIREIIPNPQVKIVSLTQVDFIIKEEYVKKFPTLFESLERPKKKLGITSISVTCTTIEDVFLNVAAKKTVEEEKETLEEGLITLAPTRFSSFNRERAEGIQVICQRIESLFWKCILYRRRRYCSFLLKTIITCLLILQMIRNSHYDLTPAVGKSSLKINLDIYPGSINPMVYDNRNKRVADTAAELIRNQKGSVDILPNDTKITQYLESLAQKDLSEYFLHTLLVLVFHKNNYTIRYQPVLNIHLPAIAANIMANVLLQNFSDGGSIETINEPFESKSDKVCKTTMLYSTMTQVYWMFYFSLTLLILTPDFIPFLTEERVSGFKHQQLMAGVSPLLYWCTNFIFDYFIYLCMVVIYMVIILSFSRGFVLWNANSTELLVLVLLLYGGSALFFVYLLTFLIDSSIISNAVFLMGNLAFGIIPAFVVHLNIISDFIIYLTVSTVFSFNPMFAATLTITKISKTIADEYLCRICGGKYCEVHIDSLLRMPKDKDRSGVLIYVLFLAFTWVLYLVVIFMIECGLGRRIFVGLFYKKTEYSEPGSEDSDVKDESERVRLHIEAKADSTPLRVEHLMKKYVSGPVAVNNVSFMVTHGECFGLLGVNGAGKTTTFKIITGSIIPDSGNSFVKKYSVISNRTKYMSLVGYCPQFDAIIASFTGEELLKIIAQLRGIPRNEVNLEVYEWLKLLAITEHSKKQSGTYSGGTKRKLSTAMAFIGDPVVVFLDEPTTGVDPMSRRRLWSVVQSRQREGQAVVLTSHSMEECEALCTRLTILRDGEMKCIGTAEYLKAKFSQGYTVLVKLHNPTDLLTERFKKAFSLTFPLNEIKDEHTTMIHYQITDSKIALSKLFGNMLGLKEQFNIVEDFTVSNTTLEQLFLSFAKKKNKRF